jgi:hypothetical protein
MKKIALLTVALFIAATSFVSVIAADVELKGHTDKVIAVAYSMDGTKIASVSEDASIRVWNAITGAELQRLAGITDKVLSIAFSPDGQRIVMGNEDGTVRIRTLSAPTAAGAPGTRVLAATADASLAGTWVQHNDGGSVGTFTVTFDSETGQYEAVPVRRPNGFDSGQILGLSNIQFDGSTWSFEANMSRTDRISQFELTKINDNTFEGAFGNVRHHWQRQSDGQQTSRSLALIQREHILEFIKPGYRYEGWLTAPGPRMFKVTFVFDEFVGPNQAVINGRLFLTDAPRAWRGFQVQLDSSQMRNYPVTGRILPFTEEALAAYNSLTGEIRANAGEFLHNRDNVELGIIRGKLHGFVGIGSNIRYFELGTPQVVE